MRTLVKDGRLTTPDDTVLTWRCEVKPTATIDLHRVTVSLRREPKDGDPVEDTLVLYALRPAWSDPVEREAMLTSKKAASTSPYPRN